MLYTMEKRESLLGKRFWLMMCFSLCKRAFFFTERPPALWGAGAEMVVRL